VWVHVYCVVLYYTYIYIYIDTGWTFIHRQHLGIIIFLAPKDEINATKPQRNQSGVKRWSNTQTGKHGGVGTGGNAGGKAIRNIVLWCVVLCSIVKYCVITGTLYRCSAQEQCTVTLYRDSVQGLCCSIVLCTIVHYCVVSYWIV